MQVRVEPIGHSAGVRIPARALSAAGLRPGDRLFLRAEGGRLVLSRTPNHPQVRGFMEAIRPMLGKEVVLVYLFGSFVTPKFRPDRSDIDLYVITRDRSGKVASRIGTIVARLNLRGEPPLGVVVFPLHEVDWGWFEYEVAPGACLYLDHEAFPDGVPPRA